VKVMIVIDSLGLGGAENLLAVLAGAAPAAGLDLHVASLTPSSMGRLALQPVLAEAGLSTSFLDISRLASPGAVPRIARAVRELGADVVHAHLGYSAILAPMAARIAGVRAAATLHHVPESLPFRERVKERMSVEVPGRLGRLIFVSEASRRAFAVRYPERSSWTTVLNGVDLTRFTTARCELPPDLGVPPGSPVVTVVAALRRPKGHAVAIDGWASVVRRVPEARLLIVGEGEERAALEEQARRAGVNERVVFAGIRRDVPTLVRASAVVALPSYTEALPTALIEAAASGRPAVATTVGGTPEVVEHGRSGLLVPPGDARAFADAVTRLLSDEPLARRMGREARIVAEERFDATAWALRLRNIYDELPASRRARPHVRSR